MWLRELRMFSANNEDSKHRGIQLQGATVECYTEQPKLADVGTWAFAQECGSRGTASEGTCSGVGCAVLAAHCVGAAVAAGDCDAGLDAVVGHPAWAPPDAFWADLAAGDNDADSPACWR